MDGGVGATPHAGFIPILSKLHWCFVHGLKICIRFGYNPQINFIIQNLSLTFEISLIWTYKYTHAIDCFCIIVVLHCVHLGSLTFCTK